MKRIVILISGRGSNMRALFEANVPGRIVGVISNNAQAPGLDFARQQAVETHVVNHREFADRTVFDKALAERVDSLAPDIIVLAGFMRILTEAFLSRFSGRVLNIHPSLLPAFPGLDTHQRALDEGVRLHGCTVHIVTAALDHGPIIVQAAVPVLPGDDAQRLAARVLKQEHRIYPMAVRWCLEDKITVANGRVQVSGGPHFPDPVVSPDNVA